MILEESIKALLNEFDAEVANYQKMLNESSTEPGIVRLMRLELINTQKQILSSVFIENVRALISHNKNTSEET